MNKEIVICDCCKKKTDKLIVDGERKDTPHNWFWLITLNVNHRPENENYAIPDRNSIKISDRKTDPHFCSVDCAVKWFRNQLERISGEEKPTTHKGKTYQRVKELVKQGLTNAEICKKLNRRRSTIAYHIRRLKEEE